MGYLSSPKQVDYIWVGLVPRAGPTPETLASLKP